jgi:hypothetical protein
VAYFKRRQEKRTFFIYNGKFAKNCLIFLHFARGLLSQQYEYGTEKGTKSLPLFRY